MSSTNDASENHELPIVDDGGDGIVDCEDDDDDGVSQVSLALAPQYTFGREASCFKLTAHLEPSSKALAWVHFCASGLLS